MKPIPQAWGANRGRTCAWDDCEKPATRRGLCRSHYDKLVDDRRDVERQLRPPDEFEPADCQCGDDRRAPVPCRIGNVRIEGAYQCALCLKRVDASLMKA